jgi:hypothetical protein
MSNERVEQDTYDRGIVPAETAARKEREGDIYKQVPEAQNEDQVDTAAGYTVDREGLVDNFAVEPEMYYEEPGDLRQKEAQEKSDRAQELSEINDTDETGKLSSGRDSRGKGTGVI